MRNEEYCALCHTSFGEYEPRIEDDTGGVYHLYCATITQSYRPVLRKGGIMKKCHWCEKPTDGQFVVLYKLPGTENYLVFHYLNCFLEWMKEREYRDKKGDK